MSRILYFCGQQNRTILSKLNSIAPTTIFKSRLLYKPIETGCRFFKTSPPVRNTIKTSSLDIDPTALTKDVIIYKYENPNYFKYMNLFGLLQFLMLSYCGLFTLGLRDRPVNKAAVDYAHLPWYGKYNLGDKYFRQGISVIVFGIGKQYIDRSPILSDTCHYYSIIIIYFRLRSVGYDLDIYVTLCSLFSPTKRRWGS